MKKNYTVDYSPSKKKWCVFKKMTASLREVYRPCNDREEAEDFADKLNKDQGK